ncbi:MAG: hypothetical protein KatS3mg032_2292 [Cyclobacteriaceae bacterium]|nr:MAG: hypothetical protein KatS3mg032_2292 [Cyclobacteriaceae bacterium]
MFKHLQKLYSAYKPYVRVDLIMYGVLLVLILIYLIFFN